MSNPTELPDLGRLEALARAATPGPWDVNQAAAMQGGRLVVDELYVYSPEMRNVAIAADIADPVTGEMSKANADFIAAANPATVLALIALARRPPVPAQRPTDDELWDSTIRDRDTYHEWADKLADAIASYFGVDIGEHSNQNCPWHEALEAIESAEPARRAQPEGEAPAPRTELSKRIREAATADVTLAQARLLIGAAEEIERAQQAAAPSALAAEAAKLAPILRGMCEGGDVHGDGVDIYADDYMAGDGDTYVVRAAALLEQIAATSAPGTPEAPADQDAARYQWLKERFTGYDFYWGGDPMAEREEDKGKCVIVFECGQDFRAGRDFEPAIDAAIKRAAQLDGGQGESHA